jgi:type II secretory ATPase GspE/PulE/Tfp pilus assembly ATPase PilB-like protein/FixJ family two-component response regulator
MIDVKNEGENRIMTRLASLFISSEEESGQSKLKEFAEPSKAVYKILFVDDDENLLKSMRRIFRRENYTILTACSGPEALNILKKEPVQIVISDHRMQEMTGAELLRKIKALYPQTIRIMLTGHADVNAIMSAVNEGAIYKFITKPWNDDDLRLTVSLALEQYDLIEENKSLKAQHKIQKKKIDRLSRVINVNRSQVGRILLKKKLITQKDLDRALEVQAKEHMILPEILINMGVVDEETIINTIQSELGINRVYPNEFTVPKALTSLIPIEICRKNLLLPLKRADNRLIVTMADPTDYMKIDDLSFIVGFPIQPAISTRKEINEKLQELYDDNKFLKSGVAELDLTDPSETIEIILDEDDEETDIEELLKAKDQPPAIRIVNAIILDAIQHNASDIHIEPKTKYIVVRYRTDGLLQEKIHIPLSMHLSIVSRIKVMCELDIAERRKPQDGRVTVKTSSKMMDMRISTLPTISGEKVVLRILDKSAAIRNVAELGLLEDDLRKVSRFVTQPQGMVLSTGPTGSGKTSTLYSLLQKCASITKNYVTIEDPVEYFMGMAEQVSVRRKIGLDFPMILRAILRQDPNVIMLGEIRDFETADVALNAALTGHLVLSTLHTNGSIASITRLRDMGIKSYVLSEALLGIVAQRLVRRICPDCRIDDNADDEVLNALKLTRESLDFKPQKGAGCNQCNNTGYTGRIGIFEIFNLDSDLKRMLHQEALESELLDTAKLAGMTTLLEDALFKTKEGITTLEEVVRVLGSQDVASIDCPQCGVHLAERFRFCPFCGGTVVPICSSCQRFMASKWRHCPYCGKNQ